MPVPFAQHDIALSTHTDVGWTTPYILLGHRSSCYCVQALHCVSSHELLAIQGEVAEEPSLSLSGALAMLTGITVIVAFASECALLQHCTVCLT